MQTATGVLDVDGPAWLRFDEATDFMDVSFAKRVVSVSKAAAHRAYSTRRLPNKKTPESKDTRTERGATFANLEVRRRKNGCHSRASVHSMANGHLFGFSEASPSKMLVISNADLEQTSIPMSRLSNRFKQVRTFSVDACACQV
jgi:hypothetical protein